MDKTAVASLMSKQLDADISPELVVELPSDGCPSHMGSGPWVTYAARCGEFVVVVKYYEKTGEIMLSIV